jgi:hypothetical protein
LPEVRLSPCAGTAPAWQPAFAQLAVKIGWMAPENETAAPHEQVPPEQVFPAPHALPHIPQLAGSVLVSTQAPLQAVVPDGQVQVPP